MRWRRRFEALWTNVLRIYRDLLPFAQMCRNTLNAVVTYDFMHTYSSSASIPVEKDGTSTATVCVNWVYSAAKCADVISVQTSELRFCRSTLWKSLISAGWDNSLSRNTEVKLVAFRTMALFTLCQYNAYVFPRAHSHSGESVIVVAVVSSSVSCLLPPAQRGWYSFQ